MYKFYQDIFLLKEKRFSPIVNALSPARLYYYIQIDLLRSD